MAESPEQLLEQQQKNCIFCKIIAGEIESRKVFENERFLAILDINPAAPGHVLLLPKEHVPILPLLPEEQMREIFELAAKIADAVKEATIAQRITLFVASGYAAGQQAPHLLLHVIPRESGDGLAVMDIEKLETPQPDALALGSVFAQATAQVLQHLGRQDLLEPVQQPVAEEPPAKAPSAPAQPSDTVPKTAAASAGTDVAEFDSTGDALQTVLAANPDLRRLIIAQPSLVEEYIRKSPKLQKLFAGVDIKALSMMLNRQEETRKAQAGERPPKAREMPQEALFRFIDGNEGLRTWLLEHPQELAANIGANPRLKEFFEGIDIIDLAQRFRAHKEGAR